jgi:hypothetical protein
MEAEATRRAISLAKVAGDTPLYIVHMSASEALAAIAEARDAGRNVFAETCPQYLYLTLEDQLGAPGFEGAKWVCSTPLRSKHERTRPTCGRVAHQRSGDRVHRPLPVLLQGPEGARLGDFSKIPNGSAVSSTGSTCCTRGRRRQAVAGALGGDDRHDPGTDVRALPAQGRDRARIRRRHRAVRPERAYPDQRGNPPHEHGPLRVRGI